MRCCSQSMWHFSHNFTGLPLWVKFASFLSKTHELYFGFVWFYGISTSEGHLMPNHFFTYIKFLISKHILKITFLNKPELVFFFGRKLNASAKFQTIQLSISTIFCLHTLISMNKLFFLLRIKCKNTFISNNSVLLKYTVLCLHSFEWSDSSISNSSV